MKTKKTLINFHGYLILAVLLFCLSFIVSCDNPDDEDDAKPTELLLSCNQHGFYPESPKFVIAEKVDGDTFTICNAADDEVVYTGTFSGVSEYDGETRYLKRGDFSDFTTAGSFYVTVPDSDFQIAFTIAEDIYHQALTDAFRFYYYQRASMDLTATCAGTWARTGGHPDTDVDLDVSTGSTGSISSPGGWYDAGDYGKYIVNGGITVATLLSLYEMFPAVIGNDMNIPESDSNTTSDLLDEIKYELDWFKTMQDSDGGVFHKLSGKSWPGFVMPAADTQQRYAFGKSTTAALNFAAVMAQAARVYDGADPSFAAFASDCETRAINAYNWAVANPDVAAPNTNTGSGAYGDSTYTDEFVWATAELYITTGSTEYAAYLDGSSDIVSGTVNIGTYITSPAINGPSSWQGVRNLGYFSLATVANSLDSGILTSIENVIIGYADDVLAYMAGNPYQSPMRLTNFVWGSNGGACNYGINLAYAWILTGDSKYYDGILNVLNYIYGQNACSCSFVTAYGQNSPLYPHSRIMGGDGIAAVIPGFLAGGPNAGMEDGVEYPSTLPEKMYVDIVDSYASNEIAINWNAPLVFILGAAVSGE